MKNTHMSKITVKITTLGIACICSILGLIISSSILTKNAFSETQISHVAGCVKDENNNPIKGVTVNIKGWLGSQLTPSGADIDLTAPETNGQGYYEFESVPAPSSLDIAAGKEGYKTETKSIVLRGDGAVTIDFMLLPAEVIQDICNVQGNVEDSESSPLMAAAVTLCPGVYENGSISLMDSQMTTHTDEYGNYSLSNVPIYPDADLCVATAAMEGYKADFKVLENLQPNQTYAVDALKLESLGTAAPEHTNATVRYFVADAEGPLPGVTVTIKPEDEDVPFYSGITDSEGEHTFQARVRSDKLYTVNAEKEGYEKEEHQGETLYAGQSNNYNFILSPQRPTVLQPQQ